MAVFFTSDWHLNHEKVSLFSGRPFTNQADHDEHIISQVNATVGENDILWVLGDVSWHSLEQEIKRIKCRCMHLIWGNHDRAGFGKFFKTSADTADIKLGEQHVFLSHYPHAFWPKSHRGSIHLYGHTHNQRERFLNEALPGRRSMDVGVDSARAILGEYRPFHEREILDIMARRPGHDDPAYYDATHGRWQPNAIQTKIPFPA